MIKYQIQWASKTDAGIIIVHASSDKEALHKVKKLTGALIKNQKILNRKPRH